MSTQETKLRAIANAIRTKEGSSSPIVANTFAERILALETVGPSSGLYRINLMPSNASGGAVHGGGIASKNMTVKVNALINDGYYFDGWTESGEKISEEKEIMFLVQKDRNLVANIFEIQHELGVDWFSTTMPVSGSWNAVIYGNGKFVAIAGGGSNKAAYSTDGVNWTAATLPASDYWQSVAYGNGRFVTVASPVSSAGSTKRAAYSTDGVNWTATTLPISDYWKSVAYGNGRFVAVTHPPLSTTSKNAAYSTDGINWTASTMPFSSKWAVTYGNGKFIAVVFNNSNQSAYSTDGINWIHVTNLPVYGSWGAVTYGGGKFVALSYKSDNAIHSVDGINWEVAKLPYSVYWYSVAYGGGKFVAVGNGEKAAYSKGGSAAA